jgi:hypothetical protein
METQERVSRGYNPDLQRAWREEQKIPIRIPRSGHEKVQQMLTSIRLPRVFLREHTKTTDIVIRLECSSQLLPVLREMYSKAGFDLPMVFRQVLSKTASKGRSTFSSELSTLGYSTYCQTWIRLFERLYQDRFHPAVNPPSWLAQFKDTFRRKTGRRRQEDAASFNERFTLLFRHCKKLQGSVEDIVLRVRREKSGAGITGKQVRENLWKEILEIPGGHSILGGEAFAEIPYATPRTVIEDPRSWTPRQLAIALLAFESDLNYQTVEKRVARHGRPTSNKSQ